jgi:hypothetical protein
MVSVHGGHNKGEGHGRETQAEAVGEADEETDRA